MTIRQHIFETIAGLLGGTPVQHVAVWNRDVEFADAGQAWARPAVFVEFDQLTPRHVSPHSTDYTLTLRLHVVADCTATADAFGLWELTESVCSLVCTQALHRAESGHSVRFATSATIASDHNHEDLMEDIIQLEASAACPEA